MKRSKGSKSILKNVSFQEQHKQTNHEKSGFYQINYYFLNDMWVFEDQFNPEIGYNGCDLSVWELNKDSIRFEVQAICGPTYHFAIAAGYAVKKGDHYLYKMEDSTCEIVLKFNEKSIFIQANQSFECGFGARAYLDHEVLKVNNQPKSIIEEE